MFVGDFNNGNIYHFELNKERTKLNFDSALEGRLNEKIIFAKGFQIEVESLILKLDLMVICILFHMARVKYLE